MAKLFGKDLIFKYDNVEIPVISVNLNNAIDQLPADDTSSGDIKETIDARATRTFTVEAFFYYNGVKLTGKDAFFTHNSIPYNLTDMVYNVNWDTIDGTDVGTTSDNKELIPIKADMELNLNLIMRDDQPDLNNNIVPIVANFKFATLLDVTGNGKVISKNIISTVNDFNKINYIIKFTSIPLERGTSYIKFGTSRAFNILLKQGVTNKEYKGNATLTQRQITANVNDLIRISYTFNVDTYQETEYSAV